MEKRFFNVLAKANPILDFLNTSLMKNDKKTFQSITFFHFLFGVNSSYDIFSNKL